MVNDDGDDDGGGGSVGGREGCEERVEPGLVSSSDSYSELEIISISISEPSSCPTLHCLLIT